MGLKPANHSSPRPRSLSRAFFFLRARAVAPSPLQPSSLGRRGPEVSKHSKTRRGGHSARLLWQMTAGGAGIRTKIQTLASGASVSYFSYAPPHRKLPTPSDIRPAALAADRPRSFDQRKIVREPLEASSLDQRSQGFPKAYNVPKTRRRIARFLWAHRDGHRTWAAAALHMCKDSYSNRASRHVDNPDGVSRRRARTAC